MKVKKPQTAGQPSYYACAMSGGVHVISLYGDLDRWQRQYIGRELRQMERFGPGAVTILDVSGTRFVDSTLLDALYETGRAASHTKAESRICIVAPGGHMMWRLFEITKLNAVFPMFVDPETAHVYASMVVFQKRLLAKLTNGSQQQGAAGAISATACHNLAPRPMP